MRTLMLWIVALIAAMVVPEVAAAQSCSGNQLGTFTSQGRRVGSDPSRPSRSAPQLRTIGALPVSRAGATAAPSVWALSLL